MRLLVFTVTLVVIILAAVFVAIWVLPCGFEPTVTRAQFLRGAEFSVILVAAGVLVMALVRGGFRAIAARVSAGWKSYLEL